MKIRLRIAVSVAAVAVAVVPPAQAQRGFGGLGGIPGFAGGQPGFGGGFHARGPMRGGGRGRFIRPRFGGRYYDRSGFIAAPYFYPPDFYANYDASQPTVTEVPAPQVVVVRATEPAVQAPPPPPVESLMLELRGDHWVRITNSGESEVGDDTQRSTHPASSRRSAAAEAAAAVRALPPAVLVFRDGHQEQTTKYTIIGPVIYTGTNYWASGGWTKKIPLAELDIPATLQLNQERGVKFNLPSAPNEVVVRP